MSRLFDIGPGHHKWIEFCPTNNFHDNVDMVAEMVGFGGLNAKIIATEMPGGITIFHVDSSDGLVVAIWSKRGHSLKSVARLTRHEYSIVMEIIMRATLIEIGIAAPALIDYGEVPERFHLDELKELIFARGRFDYV